MLQVLVRFGAAASKRTKKTCNIGTLLNFLMI